MAKLFGARIRPVASVMLISTTALAQQTSEEIASSPTKEIEKHLHNYGNFDNTCIRWTDKCRNCSRSSRRYDNLLTDPRQFDILESGPGLLAGDRMHFDQIKRRDFITFLGGVNWKKIGAPFGQQGV
jgi:hypothetical protein